MQVNNFHKYSWITHLLYEQFLVLGVVSWYRGEKSSQNESYKNQLAAEHEVD